MLFICEKPSQAKDIARVLAHDSARQMDGYIDAGNAKVTWCIGHFLEMAMPDAYDESLKKWSIEALPIFPEQWKMHIKRGMGKQFSVVKKLLKQERHTVIATDADREGEVIAREVLDYCSYKGKLQRLWLSSLDEASIKAALDNLRDGASTEALYEAGLGRARSDWLVGMNLSRAYTCLGRKAGYDKLLSIGRVQTPTLALVVKRDLSIENFKPSEYFTVTAQLYDADDHHFKAQWIPSDIDKDTVCDDQGRCISSQSAQEVAQSLKQYDIFVASHKIEKKSQNAPLPFSLSALQKVASSNWGYGAKQTLDIAQALYEKHKATTYPRSDCQYLPVEQYDEAPSVLVALSAVFEQDEEMIAIITKADSGIKSRAWNNKKITAHHAIIPTLNERTRLAHMREDEQNIYRLIVQYYLAQFYPAFEQEKTTIVLKDEAETCLIAKGSRPLKMGWKSFLGGSKKDAQEEQSLPVLSQGEQVSLASATVNTKLTKPPARYTEGSLIDAMANVARYVDDTEAKKILKENEGIGTEATRAGIIETLKDRKYLQGKGKRLISTATGRELVNMLPNELTDPVMTALMERLLSKIAHGDLTLENYMQRQERYISSLLDIAKAQEITFNH